jgi:hypothetical protein
LALILGLSLAVPDAIADYIPGRGARDFWYWSYDTAQIEIFLGGNKREGWTGAQGHTINLPRAMVIFAASYNQPEYPRLPDQIETSHIGVQLAYPDGAPLSVALAEAAWRTGKSESIVVGTEDFRRRTYSADLFHSEFGVVDEEDLSKPWSPISRNSYVPAGEFDRLEAFSLKSSTASIFFVGGEQDEFYYANCVRVLNSIIWCSYQVRINEHIHGSVSFADLRVNGGRAFANDRVRALRRALCGHMECKIVAPDGSLLRAKEE